MRNDTVPPTEDCWVELVATSAKIDQELCEARKREEFKVKLLLVGAGDVSTHHSILLQLFRLQYGLPAGAPVEEQDSSHDTNCYKTTDVVKHSYRIDGIILEVIDVTGLQSEPRKWLCCFENVDAVLFVADLSDFESVQAEGRVPTNPLSKALEFFNHLCQSPQLRNANMLVCLAKKDIFAGKLLESNIADQAPFTDYKGPTQDFKSGLRYFIQKFVDCGRIHDNYFNKMFMYVSGENDTSAAKFVLDSIRTIVMVENLQRSGFIFECPLRPNKSYDRIDSAPFEWAGTVLRKFYASSLSTVRRLGCLCLQRRCKTTAKWRYIAHVLLPVSKESRKLISRAKKCLFQRHTRTSTRGRRNKEEKPILSDSDTALL